MSDIIEQLFRNTLPVASKRGTKEGVCVGCGLDMFVHYRTIMRALPDSTHTFPLAHVSAHPGPLCQYYFTGPRAARLFTHLQTRHCGNCSHCPV